MQSQQEFCDIELVDGLYSSPPNDSYKNTLSNKWLVIFWKHHIMHHNRTNLPVYLTMYNTRLSDHIEIIRVMLPKTYLMFMTPFVTWVTQNTSINGHTMYLMLPLVLWKCYGILFRIIWWIINPSPLLFQTFAECMHSTWSQLSSEWHHLNTIAIHLFHSLFVWKKIFNLAVLFWSVNA